MASRFSTTLALASFAVLFAGCSDDGDGTGLDAGTDADADSDADADTDTDTDADADPDAGADGGADAGPWEAVPSHREDRDGYIVVWLEGTPYEMGYQHGTLLHDELQWGMESSTYISQIQAIVPIAAALGISDVASAHSYPTVLEECQGMVDAAGDVGWTMDMCLLVNFGDVVVEYLGDYLPVKGAGDPLGPGCSQLMARGAATADGRLYHGRILDWGDIDFLLKYPVIFVREPDEGNPHVTIGFPGNLSPYSGMNWHGLAIASNESDPLDGSQHDLSGRSHVQMVGQLLTWADSLDAAEGGVLAADHMTVEQFGMSDGVAENAHTFEMTATAVGVREMQDDVLWMTNHFVSGAMAGLDANPAGSSSLLRFARLEQLLAPDGVATRYGEIDPEVIVEILRDRVNPYTFEESTDTDFDNDSSLATNGAVYEIVFSPEDRVFWVAAGAIPVPLQRFVGFSMDELLGRPDPVLPDPAIIE
jgi:hypothetical protein